MVPSEPPTYDGHAEGTFGLVHPLAPHYNGLLRIDPFDRTGTKVVADLAESWTISRDGLTYTLKLRQGVKFHDGSVMTSRDVKASYDRIVNPPAGVVSYRKGSYGAIEAIEAPDPQTIRFQLKWPEASFLITLASPYSWIYKADILAKDQQWYAKNVMGTGPFKFVEHVKGSHWIGKKNPDYWDKGKPYLDGYRAIFMTSSSAQVAAIRGERAHAQFRGFSPAERDTLVNALGSEDHRAGKPVELRAAGGDEPRSQALGRQARAASALTLAMDRYEASQDPVPHRGGEGSGRDPGARHAVGHPARGAREAGRVRPRHQRQPRRGQAPAEARPAFRTASPSRSRIAGSPSPTSRSGIWLIDQWRQIGLSVKQETIEASAYHPMLKRGDFDVAMDFQCSYVVEPDIDIEKFQSAGVSDRNFSRYKDPVLDDLFVKQARATRSGGAQASPARVREAAARRGSALHLHAPVAPHHPAQQQGAGLDDHARRTS